MRALDIALKEFGVKGIVGDKNNDRILQYFKDIGQAWVKDDETAWCAAFVNWCLVQVSKPQTGKLNARSFLEYGTITDAPELGDIVILWRISKTGSFGHVGFYVNTVGENINILSGNQGNSVNITSYPKANLLGFRKIP